MDQHPIQRGTNNPSCLMLRKPELNSSSYGQLGLTSYFVTPNLGFTSSIASCLAQLYNCMNFSLWFQRIFMASLRKGINKSKSRKGISCNEEERQAFSWAFVAKKALKAWPWLDQQSVSRPHLSSLFQALKQSWANENAGKRGKRKKEKLEKKKKPLFFPQNKGTKYGTF